MKKFSIVFGVVLLIGIVLAGCSNPAGGNGGGNGGGGGGDNPFGPIPDQSFLIKGIPATLDHGSVTLCNVDVFSGSPQITSYEQLESAKGDWANDNTNPGYLGTVTSITTVSGWSGNLITSDTAFKDSDYWKSWTGTGSYLVVLTITETIYIPGDIANSSITTVSYQGNVTFTNGAATVDFATIFGSNYFIHT